MRARSGRVRHESGACLELFCRDDRISWLVVLGGLAIDVLQV